MSKSQIRQFFKTDILKIYHISAVLVKKLPKLNLH